MFGNNGNYNQDGNQGGYGNNQGGYGNNQGGGYGNNQGGGGQGGKGGGGGKPPTSLMVIIGIAVVAILAKTGAVSADFVKYIVIGLIVIFVVLPAFGAKGGGNKGGGQGGNGPSQNNGGGYNNNNGGYNNNNRY